MGCTDFNLEAREELHVYESEVELHEVQRLLDASMDAAGDHMRSIFSDDKRLSARQISRYLQGVKQVAAATVNSRGEPMVAPIDAVFLHGRFYLSTDSTSLRARHLAAWNALSVTYFENADPVIIVHGRGIFVKKSSADFHALDSEWMKAYGKSVLDISDSVVFIRVKPMTMIAYAFHPDRFPSA
jgi:uncharacterized pyridoxamine 5'-phosphate oxidase family protein